MQPNGQEQVFCLEKGKTEYYAQNKKTDKSQAGKIADKCPVHDPLWKMNHQKQNCICPNCQPFVLVGVGYVQQPSTKDHFLCDADKQHRDDRIYPKGRLDVQPTVQSVCTYQKIDGKQCECRQPRQTAAVEMQ